MKAGWALFIVLLALAGPVRAVPFTLHTNPPGADVYRVDENGGKTPIGKADAEMSSDLLPAQGRVHLLFHHDGYEDRDEIQDVQRCLRGLPTVLLKPVFAFPTALAVTAGVVLIGLAVAAIWWQRRASQVGDARRAETDPFVGRIYGGYRLTERLGEGGMALVYRGVGPREVAVKLLREDMLADPLQRRRFVREIDVRGRIRHPNIVDVYGGGEDGGQLFMVMELLQPRPLEIPAGGLPVAEIRRILEKVCAALQAAHDVGLVHRDLKPENVLLGADGSVKVSDFGLARAVDASTLTATGTILGTPAYIAPEHITGRTPEAASDQYALGVMTYEMVSGRLPYEAANPFDMLMMHLQAEPRPLDDPALRAVVSRMLAKEPEARYPSVSEAWKALSAVL